MSDSLPLMGYCAPLVSFAATWIVLALLLRALSHRMLDHPNERSLHRQPVPRIGGIGTASGVASSIPFVSPGELWPLWAAAVVLATVSFLDDMRGLPVVGRLISHFVIAGGFVVGMLPSLGTTGTILITVGIVWMINLYNFMDGMDGLAGGMAVFGFGFFAIGAVIGGQVWFAILSASIAASAASFLCFNIHPARIFLGDTGSTTFGFLAASMGVLGWQREIWSLWFPLLVFSPFIVDATVTLTKRMLRGEKFWQAHRSHCYQRLVLSGWGQRRTILAEYALMFFCGMAALAFQALSETNRFILLSIYAALFVVLVTAVDRLQREPLQRSI